MKCPNCGKEVMTEDMFCPYCGMSLKSTAADADGISGGPDSDDGVDFVAADDSFLQPAVPEGPGPAGNGGIKTKRRRREVTALCIVLCALLCALAYIFVLQKVTPKVDSLTYDQFASRYGLSKGGSGSVENAYNDAVSIDFKDVKRSSSGLHRKYRARAVVHMPDMENIYEETTKDKAVVSKLAGLSSKKLNKSETAVRLQSDGKLTADSAEDLNNKIRNGYYSAKKYTAEKSLRAANSVPIFSTVGADGENVKNTAINTMIVSASGGYGNVRNGRGMDYSIAGTIDNGTPVSVTDPEDGWYQLAAGKYSGKYISSRILSPAYSNTVIYTMYVSSKDGAPVKEGKSSKSDTLGRVDYGKKLKVTSVNDDKVKLEDGKYAGGYVDRADVSDVVYLDDDSQPVTLYVSTGAGYANVRDGRGVKNSVVGTLDNGSKVEVSHLKKGWYKVSSGDYKGSYISKKVLVADEDDVYYPEEDAETLYVFADAGYANVRDGSGKDAEVVGTIDNGTEVDVLKARKGNKWRRITSGEYEGYYISKAAVAEDYDPAVYTMYVDAGGGYANVRDGRSTDDEVVGTIDNGTEVDVKWLKKGWYILDSGEYEGKYLSEKVLTDTEPDDSDDSGDDESVSQSEAEELAVDKARSVESSSSSVDENDVQLYGQNEDAYIFLVGVSDTEGSGYKDAVWVSKSTGETKYIDSVQDVHDGMFDITTGTEN